MSQLRCDGETWQLSGELNFATVGILLKEFTLRTQQQAWPKVLDLKEVQRTDSAGVAFLLELLRLSRANPIQFQHIPAQMHSIAQVGGVEQLLTEASC